MKKEVMDSIISFNAGADFIALVAVVYVASLLMFFPLLFPRV